MASKSRSVEYTLRRRYYVAVVDGDHFDDKSELPFNGVPSDRAYRNLEKMKRGNELLSN